jgi:hypothetical protein
VHDKHSHLADALGTLLSGWRQTPLRAPGEKPRVIFDWDPHRPWGREGLMPQGSQGHPDA